MKYFTVEEARRALPEVRKVFTLCKELRCKAKSHVENLRRLESDAHGNAAQAAIERGQVEFLAGCLEHALKGLEELGVLLKGLDPGLVDFPHHMADGSEVYLCWREGEDDITHYHSTREGFAGRRPLPKPALRH
ncbi:MAG: DUF2203 domain-containing protein [Elusimicrobia bacterium]|nr:DUF2203 domain-containing protein [Elusimicrobiota bacterium]